MLHVILPESFDFIITEYSQGKKPTEFSCILRLAIFKKEEALKWLKEFEENSLTVWRCERTHRELTKKIIFKKQYHCQHNTRPRPETKPHLKHTNCKSKLTITIRQQGMKRSEDRYLKTHPCQVNIRFIHNHDFTTTAALKSRNRVKKVLEDLMDLSSSSALQNSGCNLEPGERDEYFKETVSSSDEQLGESDSSDCAVQTRDLKKCANSSDFEVQTHDLDKCVNNSDSAVQIHDLYKCADELNTIFQILNKNLFQNPSDYVEPITRFIENFKKCKTESSIISALNTFGRYSDMHVIKKSKNLQGEKLTVAQPSANAKRKINVRNKLIFSKNVKPLALSLTDALDEVHEYVKKDIEKGNSSHLLVSMVQPLSLPVGNFTVNNNS